MQTFNDLVAEINQGYRKEPLRGTRVHEWWIVSGGGENSQWRNLQEDLSSQEIVDRLAEVLGPELTVLTTEPIFGDATVRGWKEPPDAITSYDTRVAAQIVTNRRGNPCGVFIYVDPQRPLKPSRDEP